jgi:DNA-binding MarR family transcriptional regulator
MEQARAAADALLMVTRQVFLPDDGVTSELPVAQLRVCGLLYGSPRPMSALSRELGISLSAMTQIADRLERADLVRRVAEGTDRRVRCLKLTERGEGIMRQREAARVRRVRAVLERLPLDARREALAMLEVLAKASEGAGGGQPCPAAIDGAPGPQPKAAGRVVNPPDARETQVTR